jgi:hypothetical protein
VLVRGDERFDHLGAYEVAVEPVGLREPEVVARSVGVAPRIPEVFHQDEGGALVRERDGVAFDDRAQRERAALRVARGVCVYRRLNFRSRGVDARAPAKFRDFDSKA